jgi:XTP/dITP diphosphohydrolase
MIAILTGNTKKYAEMAEALSHHGIVVQRVEGDIDEIQHLDARAVITDKVQKAFAQVAGPVLVDDSGIYFEPYRSFPGTYSKYLFKAIGYGGIFKLVQPGDRAWFHCFVAYMDETLSEPAVFDAHYFGTITDQFDQKQESEMPYAPLFIPDGEQKTMALMTPLERAADHRHQAVNAFAQWYVTHQKPIGQ